MRSHPPLWHPDLTDRTPPLLHVFQAEAGRVARTRFNTYADLHSWSVRDPAAFWSLAWSFCGVQGDPGPVTHIPDPDPLKAQFFPRARLNVTDTFLKNADERPAIIFVGEDGRRMLWTRAELKREVEMLAAAMRAEGIGRGDRGGRIRAEHALRPWPPRSPLRPLALFGRPLHRTAARMWSWTASARSRQS